MATQITKWGNSLAVRLPRRVADEAKLKQGDTVEIVVPGAGRVEVRVRKQRRSLKQLVNDITAENLHAASEWGKPVGRELW